MSADGGWRTMNTAPRDTQVVLVWCNDDVEFAYCEGSHWWIVNNGDYCEGGYGRPYRCQPEFWQPLPPPPAVNPDVKEQGKCTSAETAGRAGKPEIS